MFSFGGHGMGIPNRQPPINYIKEYLDNYTKIKSIPSFFRI